MGWLVGWLIGSLAQSATEGYIRANFRKGTFDRVVVFVTQGKSSANGVAPIQVEYIWLQLGKWPYVCQCKWER